jgi:tetratricopeptide (TPR) repeat protein
VIGISLKFFGLEKKYIAPMVEDSFEQLKTSPRMREINRKLNEGDTAAAIPLLLAVIDEEPENYDAPLMLARIYHEKGDLDAAAAMYNRSLTALLRAEDHDLVLSILEEMREKTLMHTISEKNLYNLGLSMEAAERYQEAAELFGMYIRQFPDGRVRAKALQKVHRLFKDKLDRPLMAREALAFLKKEYPAFPVQE